MNDAQNTVDVLLTGNTLPGADIDQAAAAFAGLTRLSPEQTRDLITCGKLTLLRRGLSPEKGLALTARFASMGIEAITRPGAAITTSRQEAPKQTTAPNVSQVQQGAKSGQQPYAQLGASFCTNCGNTVAEQAVACTTCGFPPRLEKKFCHNCGTAIDARQVICVKCGISFGNQTTLQTSAAASGAPPAAPIAPPAATGTRAYAPPRGERMTFGRAVSTCFKKYADFSGRASRSEYWYFHIFLVLAAIPAYIAALAVAASHAPSTDENVIRGLLILFMLPFLLPYLAVTARRLHDMDFSGWLVLVDFIPFVGSVIVHIMAMFRGTEGPNRFGEEPVDGGKGLGCFLLLLFGGVMLVPILAAISIPQFAGYRMRAYNSSAQSDLRNASTGQEILMSDYGVYGKSREGTLPGPGGGTLELLVGPLPAATGPMRGAMLSAANNGRPVGTGIAVASGVNLIANGGMYMGREVYYVLAKHQQGDQVFLATSERYAIYTCRNKTWVGIGIPETALNYDIGNNPEGQFCGGNPVATWQAL